MREELLDIKKRYRTPRRSTLVYNAEEADAERADVRGPGAPSFLCISADGKLKCISEKNFNQSNKALSDSSRKSSVLVSMLPIRSDEQALVFTDRGNCYRLYAEQCMCKFSDAGHALGSLFEDAEKGETPVAVLRAEGNGNLLFVTRKGMLKKTAWSEYAVAKSAFQAIRLSDGDAVLTVEQDAEEEGTTMFFVSRRCMCANVKKDDIPLQGRIAGGVRGMNLADGDELVFFVQFCEEGEIIVATSSGRFKRVIAANVEEYKRNCKGVRISDPKQESVIFAGYVTMPYYLAVLTEDGGMKELSSEDLPIDAANTRGRTLKGIKWKAKEIYPMKYRPVEE